MKKNFGSKIVKNAIVTAMTIMLVMNPMMPAVAQEEITIEEAMGAVNDHFEGVKDAYDVIDDYDKDADGNEDEDTLTEALEAIGSENDQIQTLVGAVIADSSMEGTLGSYQNDVKKEIATVDKEAIKVENDKADNIGSAFAEDNYDGLAELIENIENNKKNLEVKEEGITADYTAAESLLEYYDAIRQVFGYPGLGAVEATQGNELGVYEGTESEFPNMNMEIEDGKDIGPDYPITQSDILTYSGLIQNIDPEAIKDYVSVEDYKTIKLFKEKYEMLVSHYYMLGDREVLEESAAKRAEQEKVTGLYNEFNTLITDTENAFNHLATSMNAEISEKNDKAREYAVAADEETMALLAKVEEIKKEAEAGLTEVKDAVVVEEKAVSTQAEAVKKALKEVLEAKGEADVALKAMDQAIADRNAKTIEAVEGVAEEAVKQAEEAEAKAEEAFENAKNELAELLKAYERYEKYTADMNASEADEIKAVALANIEKAVEEVEKAIVVKNAAKEGTEMANAIATVAANIATAEAAVDNATSNYEAAKEELAKLEVQFQMEKDSVELKNKIEAAQKKVDSAEIDLNAAQAIKENVEAAYDAVVAKAKAYYARLNAVDEEDDDDETPVITKKPSVEVINLTSLSALGIILDEAVPLASDADVAPEKAYVMDCTNKQYNVSANVIAELKNAGYTQIIVTHKSGIASVYDLDEMNGAVSITINPINVTSVGQGFKAIKLSSGNAIAAISHVMLDAEVVYVFNYDKTAGAYISAGVATTVAGVSAMVTGNNTLLLY